MPQWRHLTWPATLLKWPRSRGAAAPSCWCGGGGQGWDCRGCRRLMSLLARVGGRRSSGQFLMSGVGAVWSWGTPISWAGSGGCRALSASHRVPDWLGTQWAALHPCRLWGCGLFCRSGGGRSYGLRGVVSEGAFAPIGYLIWAVMGWVPTYLDAIFGRGG